MTLYGLSKDQRIRGKKRIDAIFASDKTGFCYPFRYIYRVNDTADGDRSGISVLVSVPKRNHKKAVVRNLLKRRTREAFRQRQNEAAEAFSATGKHLDIALLYAAKEQLEFKTIDHAVGKILGEIQKSI